RREAKLQGEAQELGKLMSSVSVTIAQKSGENDQLFGSVTAHDVAVALEKLGYTIDRKKVHLDEPIKQLGDFKASVRLHREASIDTPIHVVKEDECIAVGQAPGRRNRRQPRPGYEPGAGRGPAPQGFVNLLDPAHLSEAPVLDLL